MHYVMIHQGGGQFRRDGRKLILKVQAVQCMRITNVLRKEVNIYRVLTTIVLYITPALCSGGAA
jgi:hypothetical protein